MYHKCSLLLCNDNKLVKLIEVLMKFEEALCAIMHCELYGFHSAQGEKPEISVIQTIFRFCFFVIVLEMM